MARVDVKKIQYRIKDHRIENFQNISLVFVYNPTLHAAIATTEFGSFRISC